MALSQLTSSDAGASARDKINAGLTEADKVSGLAAILAALQITLAPYTDLVGSDPNRPGDAKTLFTRVMTGSPKLRPAIDKGTIENGGDLGQVLRISGADTDPVLGYIDVAPRRIYHVRPGRAYLVHYEFARFQDPTDPEQNALELRLQNLNANYSQVSNVRLGDAYAPTTGNGAFFIDIFIGKAGAPGTPIYTVPNTACYVVPFFRIYGNGQQTDLGNVRLYDVSDALAGGADIASIIARVAKLEVSQSSNVIYATTWTDDLSPRSGRIAGAGAEVQDSDTGSHTDPVTGATVPNAGKYQWSVSPVGWRWVGISNARQAALFIGQGIPTVPASKIPTLLFMGIDPATGAVADASAADFKAYIEGINVGPKTYPTALSGLTAELTSKVIIGADEQRSSVQVQCDTHDLAFDLHGGDASFTGDFVVYAGGVFRADDEGTDPISVIARPAALRTVPGAVIPAPLAVNVRRFVPGMYNNGSLFADTVLSAFPDQSFKKSYRAVLRDQINRLNDEGKWAGLGIFIVPVHSKVNGLVNLARPKKPMILGADTSQSGLNIAPYVSAQTPLNAFLDTVVLPSEMGYTQTSNFFAIQAAPVVEASGILFGNAPNFYLKPNTGTAGNPTASFKNGSGQDTTVPATTPAPLGSWIAMNRVAQDAYEAWVEDNPIASTSSYFPPRPALAVGERSFYLGANHISSGATDFSRVPWRCVAGGAGFGAATSIRSLRIAMKAIIAAGEAAAQEA